MIPEGKGHPGQGAQTNHEGDSPGSLDAEGDGFKVPALPEGAVESMVLKAAGIIMDGSRHELRVIVPGKRKIIWSGVFTTPDEVAEAALPWDGKAGVYIGVNSTSLDPLPLRMVKHGEAVSDDQIERIAWLPVDVDPDGGSDPAAVALAIREFLRELGFPDHRRSD